MHYIIDGYNLIYRGFQNRKTQKEQRDRLISLLLESISIPTVLVFDGHSRMEEEISFSKREHLSIIYTRKGETADSYIMENLSYRSIVVTSDKKLASCCRNEGAKVQTVEEFLEMIQKKRKKVPNIVNENAFQDSPKNIERLLSIFEKKLSEEES